jgi:hypothetical protein
MPYYPPVTGPPQPSLAERLDLLNRHLDVLGRQLRDGIARAVAQAVSGAVEQALGTLLGKAPAQTQWPYQGEHRPANRWDDDPDDEDMDPWTNSPHPQYARPTTPPAAPNPPGGHFASALAVGLRTAVWWFRQARSRRPVLTTLAVGLAAGIAVLAAGASSAVGLVGTALGALAVADVTRSGVSTLANTASR